MGLGKLVRSGMVGGLAGMAASRSGIGINDIARNGGFGLLGMALAKKKRREDGGVMPVGGAARRMMVEEGSDARNMKKGGKAKTKKMAKTKKYAKGGSTDKRSWSDKTAARSGVPGKDRQTPAETTGIYMGDRHITNVTSNWRGLMGGNPTDDARGLRRVAKFDRKTGATDSAKAAETRAKNIDGHNAMTRTAKKAIQENKRMANSRAREATAAKRRSERPEYAKGGKVTRGDGIAKKGHTKGRMV